MIILLSNEDRERKLALVSENYALLFKSVHDKETHGTSCAIELIPKHELLNHRFKKLSPHEIDGFIGLLEIGGHIFIGTITGKSKIASPIPGETVDKIYAVDFFCLNDSRWDYLELDATGRPIVTSNKSEEPTESMPKHPCHDLRKLLSNGSFYYSIDFDLTTSLQSRGFKNYSMSANTLQEEYMWNSFLMKEVIEYRDRLDDTLREILDDEGFLTTVIRGFAETFTTYIKRLKIALTVISKQSWKRAGTRYNARGIDDEANVANFVETELIMYSNEYCYAFTQVRGSVPVFWEQDAAIINAKIQITRSIEATQPVFDQHFLRLREKYGVVNIVNLLSTKPNEIELSRRYKTHLKRSERLHPDKDIFFTEFDFHRETSQEGFDAARNILPLVKDFLLNAGYYCYDVKDDHIISEQQGVFRTNCLDCLDRTNLLQQLLSVQVFNIFLTDVELIPPRSNTEDSDFIKKHNNLWADHGDQISQIYTGTNALKSSYSRKGKMSFAGALSDARKSVSRMYINNFMDKGKQQNIDALLGRLPNQVPVKLYDPINEYISLELSKLSKSYTTRENMNLLIGTYNVNGMSKKADLSKWLFPIGDKFKPDIVVLGLQEVIELTAGSVLNADYTKGSFWENLVKDCLNQYGEKYVLLRVEQMSSLIILFFVKGDKTEFVKRVEGSTKKTGFGGMAGNKGAVAIRFDYSGTSFCFVNSHFSAGASNVDQRANDYASINKNITFARSRKISHHDSIFWLGDLNYRISLPNETVRKELEMESEGYIDRLLQYDQLTQEIDSGVIFQDFCEPTLQFRPTYKLDFGSDQYDTSEKARTPSWTDRIVYKGTNLHPLAYSSAPLTVSDHRPVYAAYRTDVDYVDDEIKDKLIKKLYEEFRLRDDEKSRNHLSSDNEEMPYEEEELEDFLETKKKPAIPTARSATSLPFDPSSRSPSTISLPNSIKSPRPMPNVPSIRVNSSEERVPPRPPASRTKFAVPTVTSKEDEEDIPDLISLSSSSSRESSAPSPLPTTKPRKLLLPTHVAENAVTLPKKKIVPLVPKKKPELEKVIVSAGINKKIPPVVPKKKPELEKLEPMHTNV